MEENAKEIEQELRQDVDTLQTQVHDVSYSHHSFVIE